MEASIYKTNAQKSYNNDPGNYRGISLQNCISKLFATILNDGLYEYLESKNKFHEGQSGFKKNRQTSDTAFLLRHVIEKNFSKSRKVYTAFADYKRAFDTIPRKLLLHKLNKIGVALSAINVINAMYSGTESVVKLLTGITDTFHQSVGLKQGCPLSPLLFNININDLEDFLVDFSLILSDLQFSSKDILFLFLGFHFRGFDR